MCYNAAYYQRKLEKMEERYGEISLDESLWAAKTAYNGGMIANAEIPTLSWDRPHELIPRVWGFHPSWARDMKKIYSMRGALANCRADKLITKLKTPGMPNMYKGMMARPVVILFNGFYEWRTLQSPKLKVPYYHKLKSGEMMAIAGISTPFTFLEAPAGYDTGREYEGVVLMTTGANALTRYTHNMPAHSTDERMPALLEPEQMKGWLDTSIPDLERLTMLSPYPSDAMEAYSIPNYLKKDTKHLFNTKEGLEPVNYKRQDAIMYVDGAEPPAEEQPTLF